MFQMQTFTRVAMVRVGVAWLLLALLASLSALPLNAAETPQSVGMFYTIDPSQVKVGGEIGRRIDNTIHANLLALDLENVFVKAFREKKDWPAGYVGIGKLIDSCVSFARYSHDPKVIELKDRLIRELIATQLDDGYIGLKPGGHRVFEYWDLHEMVYIIFALVDDYRYFHHQPSLDAARRLGDFIMKNRKGSDKPQDTGKLNTERAMIALSDATGDARYRDYAVEGMKLRQWNVPVGGHAYTFMNVCVAQLDLYREKPDQLLLTQSRKVIDYLTKNDGLAITGTCSLGEGFHDNQDTRGNLGESCATAYLIRLAHNLLQLEGNSLNADIMERAIYNALFAAQEPTGRHLRYFTCVDGPRIYFDKDSYCCPGNWRRIVAELPGMIYYRSADGGILVNLYTFSSAEAKLADDLTVRLRQETDYPNSGHVSITVQPSRIAQFPLRLRIPRWAPSATVAINGQKIETPLKPGDLATIKRMWKSGDTVTLDMPMEVRLVKGRKLQAGKVAVMRGPMVFCLPSERPASALIANESGNSPDVQHAAEKAQKRQWTLDTTSITGPAPNKASRPDGLALHARVWGPNSDRSKPADVSVALTEYPDPAGEWTFLSASNLQQAVDDELAVTPATK